MDPPSTVWSNLDMSIFTMDADVVVDELTFEQGLEEIDNFYGKTPTPPPATAEGSHTSAAPPGNEAVNEDPEDLPDAPPLEQEYQTADSIHLGQPPHEAETQQPSPSCSGDGAGFEPSPDLPIPPSNSKKSEMHHEMRLEDEAGEELPDHDMGNGTPPRPFPLFSKPSSNTVSQSSAPAAEWNIEALAAAQIENRAQSEEMPDADIEDDDQADALQQTPTQFSNASKRTRGPSSPLAQVLSKNIQDASPSIPPMKKQKVSTSEKISLPRSSQPEDANDEHSPPPKSVRKPRRQQRQVDESGSSLIEVSSSQQSSSPAIAAAWCHRNVTDISLGSTDPDQRNGLRHPPSGTETDEQLAAKLHTQLLGLRARPSRAKQAQDRRDSAVRVDAKMEDHDDDEDEEDQECRENDQKGLVSYGQTKPKLVSNPKRAVPAPATKKHPKADTAEVLAPVPAPTRATRQTTAAATASVTPKKIQSTTAGKAASAKPTESVRTKRDSNATSQRKTNAELANSMTKGLGSDNMRLGANYTPRETRAGAEAKKSALPNPGMAAKRRHQHQRQGKK